jgi:PAS domain S-box-containing protein
MTDYLPQSRFTITFRSGQRCTLRLFKHWLSIPLLSRLTISARITVIALTLAVPLNLVIVAVIWRLSDAVNETQRTSLLHTARMVAAAVDATLEQYIALAEALARSPTLLEDNLEAFEAEARRAFVTADAWVAVADLEGQQLINMLKRPGQQLPVRNPPGFAAQKRAFKTHSTMVAGVRFGKFAQDWLISIEVPIFKDGQPFRGLAVVVKAHSIFRLLNAQQTPKDWLACIIDHDGRFIARVPSHERNVGELAPEGFRKVKDQDGIFEFLSAEGDPIVTANVHSAVSGWPVAIAIKKAEMQAATWNTIRWAAILGGGFSIFSLLLAGVMARTIAGPLARLRQKAGALLAGPASSMLPPGPPEVRDLWQALRQSAVDRDRSDQALRESEQKLRLALDAAQLGIWRWDAGQGTGEMEWDSRCRALFGVPADARVTHETWANCIVAEDRARAEANVARSLDPDDPLDQTVCEYRVKHPDGTVRWLCSTGRAYFEPDPGSRSGRHVAFKAGAVRDVTHVHLAEAALRESEERFHGVFEHAATGIAILDLESRLLSCNPAYSMMVGYSEPELRQFVSHGLVHPEDRDANVLQCSRLVAEEIPSFDIINRYLDKDGKSIWVHKYVSLLRNAAGKPTNILALVTDITERKRFGAALKESEERFRGIFENAATGIAITDLEGRFQACNPAYSTMIGYSEGELRELTVTDIQHPEDAGANLEKLRDLIAERIPSFELINRIRGKGDKILWVHKHVSLLRDAAGRPTNTIGLITDITERKRAEAALRESEGRFRGIFENAGTGIAIADLRGRLQSGNPAYGSMLGYSEEELRELTIQDLMHPEDFEECMSNFRRLVAEEMPSFETLNRYIAKDGKPLWVHKHVSLLRDNGGTPHSAMALVTDMTERRRQEEQITLLMREVNHRSKNMLSLVQAVARQTLAANPADFLDRFGKRIEALAASQDLLVKNAWKGADLTELVSSQLAHFEDLIGTRIQLQGPPVFVFAPAAQAIGMALHELATNAGKYGALSGSEGQVDIAWYIQRGDQNEETFFMSWREHCAHSISVPSKLGFGSSVISTMAEMSLSARVELDYPATGLTWQLTCAAAEVLEGKPNSVSILENKRSAGNAALKCPRPRILVVEDEALVAMEIANALTIAGFDVIGPARNVAAAFALVKRSDCDGAVLDINLGHETSEAIAIELTSNKTPFVTLSGYSSEQHHPVFAAAPALRKPLRPQLLVAELKKCIGRKDSFTERAEQAPHAVKG